MVRDRRKTCAPTAKASSNAAGQVALKLKTAWRDGSTRLVIAPLEFMQRVVALVLMPRLHLIRLHSLLAKNARLRAKAVPQELEANCARHRPVRLNCAELLKRV